jgi:hypothetical protein
MATTSVKPTIQDGHEAREMTNAEFAQYEIDLIANKAQQQAQADKATAKQVVLDRLGITADEAALLLG